MTSYPATLGAILGGGLARRMGGVDKALLELASRPLLSHVQERLAPQCQELVLNANGDPSRFGASGLTIVPDSVSGHLGPLAGVLAALEWAALHRPHFKWVVSVPADTPLIPLDLVQRLHEARQIEGLPLACAASGARDHFAIGLWPVHLRQDLRQALVEKDMRRVEDWVQLHGMARASWPVAPGDPFFNINTPDDLAKARGLVKPRKFRHEERHQTSGLGRISMMDLDLSGLKCPLPVLRTRKALLTLNPGDQLQVTCTDPLAGIDVPNLIRELGDNLLEHRQDGNKLTFVIRKAEPA